MTSKYPCFAKSIYLHRQKNSKTCFRYKYLEVIYKGRAWGNVNINIILFFLLLKNPILQGSLGSKYNKNMDFQLDSLLPFLTHCSVFLPNDKQAPITRGWLEIIFIMKKSCDVKMLRMKLKRDKIMTMIHIWQK
jgi:hypothetical protein